MGQITPEEIVALAGTRKAMEYSTHYATEGATGQGSARIQHQFKVDPNKVRALPPGQAYVISRGKAMKIRALRAPDLRGALPGPVKWSAGQELRSRRQHRARPQGFRSNQCPSELAGASRRLRCTCAVLFSFVVPAQPGFVTSVPV